MLSLILSGTCSPWLFSSVCCSVVQYVLQCGAVCVAVWCSVHQQASLHRTKDTHGSTYHVWQHMLFMDMGWRRSVGSIKLQVTFAEYRLLVRALLQKRPIILSILLTEATPYHLIERVLSDTSLRPIILCT